MAHINLLPWREQERQRKQQAYMAVLGATIAVTLLIMYSAYSIIGGVIDGQRHRNAFLKQEIVVLDKQIEEIEELKKKKAELTQRMSLISELQKNRNMVTRVFNELAYSVPGGVYLTEFTRVESGLSVKGKSESNNHLSNMMRRIVSSEWLSEPAIRSISADKKEKLLSEFSMNLGLRATPRTVKASQEEQP